MMYFEKSTFFPYKTIDPLTNKPQWRISVDMGLHTFLKYVERDLVFWLDLGMLTKSVLKEHKVQMEASMIIVYQLLNGLTDTATLMDSIYLEALNDFTKEMLKSVIEVDKQTTYNIDYWKKLIEEFNKLNVLEEPTK